MVQQLAELVVDLSLVLVLLVLLLDLPLQHLEEFRLQQHFFDGDEDLQDHLKDLTLCVFEPDAVRDNYFVVDQLVSMQRDQVFQLVIDDLELFADELFKQKDISILIDVVESVDVGTQCTPYLPTIRVLQTFQTVSVRVDIFQLSDVNEVFALDYHGEKFEEARNVALFRVEGEVISSAGEIDLALEDEAFEAVVLEAVHQYLLVYSEPFVVEQQYAPEGVDDLALLIVIVDQHVLVIFQDIVGHKFLLIELNAGL